MLAELHLVGTRRPLFRRPPRWLAVLVLLASAPLAAFGALSVAAPAAGLGHAAPRAVTAAQPLPDVVLHPVVHPHFLCLEHPEGQLTHLGDALASDCFVTEIAGGAAGRFPVFYRGRGERNEDWYGWREPVLAPFDGVVDSVVPPPAPNVPGHLRRVRAGIIVFRRPSDDTRVLYAHVQDIRVQAGDTVRAGEPVARVGNNGPAYFPHTHVGAYRADTALQIRFDLRAMGRMSRASQIGRAGW